MEALIKFSFERWEKCQYADLVVELGDDNCRQLPVAKATYDEYSDTFGKAKRLIMQVSENGKMHEFVVHYFVDCDSWQYSNMESDEWFDLYIKVR